MKKQKLLNQLTDLIEEIELTATDLGVLWANKKSYIKVDKKIARAKTKAFAIIDKLRNSEKPKDKLGDEFTKFLKSEGYEVIDCPTILPKSGKRFKQVSNPYANEFYEKP